MSDRNCDDVGDAADGRSLVSPVDAFDPAAAFALLGDETRLRILRALWEAQRESDDLDETGIPFEALRERAEVPDSGRFNYHLGKLTDRFVERTDTGYRLRFAGNRVVGALLEGTYAPGDDFEIPVEGECWHCGGPLALRYTDERVHVTCADCGVDTTDFGCPPGVLAGRDREAIPAVVDAHLRTLLARARRGICPTCSGPVHTAVGPAATAPGLQNEAAEDDDSPVVMLRCDRCGDRIRAGVPALLFDRPAVIAFLHEHGIDPEAAPQWVLFGDRDLDITIEGDEGGEGGEDDGDAYRAGATFDAGGDALTVTVDADGTVVSVETAPTSAT